MGVWMGGGPGDVEEISLKGAKEGCREIALPLEAVHSSPQQCHDD